jgi:hypothetical protein
VEDLLGTSCAVDTVAPETASREDLSTFKLSAWASDLESILVARTLVIPEPREEGDDNPSPAREFSDDSHIPTPARSLEELPTLRYRVLIHVDRLEEDMSQRSHGFFLARATVARAASRTRATMVRWPLLASCSLAAWRARPTWRDPRPYR